MTDILHRVGATATPAEVYDALTTVDGLAAWWTEDTQGDAALVETGAGAPHPQDVRISNWH